VTHKYEMYHGLVRRPTLESKTPVKDGQAKAGKGDEAADEKKTHSSQRSRILFQIAYIKAILWFLFPNHHSSPF
jgi:hypothetical protein